MKKTLIAAVCAVLALGAFQTVSQAADAVAGTTVSDPQYFHVFSDNGSSQDHFVPSGFMGDYSNIKLKPNQKLGAHSGETCLRFTYTPTEGAKGSGWAGVQWQNPEGNWGSQNGGFDLSRAKRLTFWARGRTGGEVIEKFYVGGINAGAYPDTDQESIGPVTLTGEWKQYTIDLSDSDMSYTSGGFGWATSQRANNGEIIFYLDDIRYEFE